MVGRDNSLPVRVGSAGVIKMNLYLYKHAKKGGLFYMKAERWGLFYMSTQKGVYSISFGFKKGGLSGRAYPHTFSMGVPPPRE